MKLLVFMSLLALNVQSSDLKECGYYFYSRAEPMIVGGWAAQEGEFPWMASLQDVNGIHFCGGAIIDKHWILTAAHCLDRIVFEEELKVVAGVLRLDKRSEKSEYTVQRLVRHPDYPSDKYNNDIALIRINGEIHLKELKASTICLPEEFYHVTGHVTAAGWGHTFTDSPNSVHLMAVDLPIVSQSLCRSKYNGQRVGNGVFCAGSHEGKDTCYGDSGGPVIQRVNGRAFVVGITSTGHSAGCGHKGWPSIYTEVSKHVNFINNVIL